MDKKDWILKTKDEDARKKLDETPWFKALFWTIFKSILAAYFAIAGISLFIWLFILKGMP